MYWLSSAWEEEAMTHVFPWVSHVDADVVYIWRYYVWAWDKKKSGGKSTNTKTAYPLWRWQLCIYVKTSFARAFITPPLLLYKVSLPFFATPQTACCSQGHGRMPDFDCLNPPLYKQHTMMPVFLLGPRNCFIASKLPVNVAMVDLNTVYMVYPLY